MSKGQLLMTVEGMKMEVRQKLPQECIHFLKIGGGRDNTSVTAFKFCAFLQTNILAVKDGVVKSVFYEEKNNVPAYSKVVEFKES